MWPKWPQMLQCPADGVSNHPWCNCGDNIAEPSNEGQADGEQAEMQRVDKGKQRAYEVSSYEVSPSEPVGPEEARGRHHGCEQTWGHSQSRCPHKHIKSANDKDTAKPTHCGVTKTYDLHHPPPDFPILPATDQCDHCTRRMLPCARKEDHACFQCNKGKHGCSLSLKCVRSRLQSRAPGTRTSQPNPAPSPATTAAPIRTNPPRSARKHKAKSPAPVGVTSAGPALAAGPSTLGPSRGRRESKLNISFPPFC